MRSYFSILGCDPTASESWRKMQAGRQQRFDELFVDTGTDEVVFKEGSESIEPHEIDCVIADIQTGMQILDRMGLRGYGKLCAKAEVALCKIMRMDYASQEELVQALRSLLVNIQKWCDVQDFRFLSAQKKRIRLVYVIKPSLKKRSHARARRSPSRSHHVASAAKSTDTGDPDSSDPPGPRPHLFLIPCITPQLHSSTLSRLTLDCWFVERGQAA